MNLPPPSGQPLGSAPNATAHPDRSSDAPKQIHVMAAVGQDRRPGCSIVRRAGCDRRRHRASRRGRCRGAVDHRRVRRTPRDDHRSDHAVDDRRNDSCSHHRCADHSSTHDASAHHRGAHHSYAHTAADDPGANTATDDARSDAATHDRTATSAACSRWLRSTPTTAPARKPRRTAPAPTTRDKTPSTRGTTTPTATESSANRSWQCVSDSGSLTRIAGAHGNTSPSPSHSSSPPE